MTPKSPIKLWEKICFIYVVDLFQNTTFCKMSYKITVMCRRMSHPLCPRMSADIARHPVTSRDKSYLRGVLGRNLNENKGQVGNAQNNY